MRPSTSRERQAAVHEVRDSLLARLGRARGQVEGRPGHADPRQPAAAALLLIGADDHDDVGLIVGDRARVWSIG